MSRRAVLGGLVMIGLAAAVGCYTASTPDARPAPMQSVATTEIEPAADLPCDVARVLGEGCSSCHGPTLAAGAPNHLLSRADLAAPSMFDPERTEAEESIARMRDPKKPMPPSAVADPEDVAILEAWVAAGMPTGSCAVEAVDWSSPTVCTSDKVWDRGDDGSDKMHPGVPCIECHAKANEREAFVYSVAGTVYPTPHEPDDCYGVGSSSMRVVVTDANGTEHKLPVNGAGNFMLKTKIAMPYRVKVTANGRTREMQDAVDDGDCNRCHSERGDDEAPGRILAP